MPLPASVGFRWVTAPPHLATPKLEQDGEGWAEQVVEGLCRKILP